MTRFLIVGLLTASLGGFALGWYVLSRPAGAEQPAPPPDAPLAEAVHRFPLSADDVRLDRETPAVAADAHDRVVLAWAAASGDLEHTLWLARSADGGRTFEPPVAFRKVPIYRYTSGSKGKEMTYSTNAVPRLAADGDAIYLGWTEAIGGGPRVDFLVARSTDGGKTFSEPLRAHGDEAVRPGFTALTTGPGGSVACCWLDGRRKAQLPFWSLLPAGADAFQPEALAHAGHGSKGVCPCCSTDVLRTADGATFVGFRDNDDDYRDICVTHAAPGGGFAEPERVNAERWRFNGCPHDGPSLALFDGRLHVAWMDAHEGRRRVYCASSALPEMHFEPRPMCPSGLGEQGHPRLMVGGGRLDAAWDGSLGDEAPAPAHESHAHGSQPALGGAGRAILYARLGADGEFGPAHAIDPRPGAFQVNPALALAPSGAAFVTWNEITESGKTVGFARVPARCPCLEKSPHGN